MCLILRRQRHPLQELKGAELAALAPSLLASWKASDKTASTAWQTSIHFLFQRRKNFKPIVQQQQRKLH
jgi:hypothetical protein